MKTRPVASLAAAVIACALAGCHPANPANPASAAESSAAATTAADARAYFAPCIPGSAAGQVKLALSLATKTGWVNLLRCGGVPRADLQPAAACVLGNLEKGGKPPRGATGRLDAVLADAYPCAKRYRDGGAIPSMAATPSIPGSGPAGTS